MVQLEFNLEPISETRSQTETESYRNQILRVFIAGRQKKSLPVSVEYALESFVEDAFIYFPDFFREKGFYKTDGIDHLVAQAINQALPVLQGKKGDYQSLGDYRWNGFDNVLYNIAANKRRELLAIPRDNIREPKLLKQAKKETVTGFQPSLFSFGRIAGFLEKKYVDHGLLLADLNNPRRVIYNPDPVLAHEREQIFSSFDPQYFSRLSEEAKEAMRIWIYNPDLNSNEIVEILVDEGYDEVTDAAVRMWILRGKKSSEKQPTPQLV